MPHLGRCGVWIMGSRPSYLRGVQRRFWVLIRAGCPMETAAESVGVSATRGRLWFSQAGGMTPMTLPADTTAALAGEPLPREWHLSLQEREEIAVLRA